MNRYSIARLSALVKAWEGTGGAGTVASVSPRRRTTIRDVAAATGLSPAAVSYALRGIQTSPETQERVKNAADELGYSANAEA